MSEESWSQGIYCMIPFIRRPRNNIIREVNRLVFARGWGWGAAAVVIKGEHGEAWHSNTLIVVAITGDRTPSAIRTHTRPRAHGKRVQSERALSTVCASVSWCRYCRLVTHSDVTVGGNWLKSA